MKEKLLSLTLPGGQEVVPPEGVPTTGEGGLAGIISWVIIILTSVGIIAALIFLIIGAIKWITSGGDKEKLDSARRTIIYSIIGLVVIILSLVIMNFIGGLLGINVFQSASRPGGGGGELSPV